MALGAAKLGATIGQHARQANAVLVVERYNTVIEDLGGGDRGLPILLLAATASSRLGSSCRSLRWKRTVLMVRRAEIAQPYVRITLNAPRQRRAEAGFANPWLARDQDHLPVSGFRLLPPPK